MKRISKTIISKNQTSKTVTPKNKISKTVTPKNKISKTVTPKNQTSKTYALNKILLLLILINLYVFSFGLSLLIGDSNSVQDTKCNTNPNTQVCFSGTPTRTFWYCSTGPRRWLWVVYSSPSCSLPAKESGI